MVLPHAAKERRVNYYQKRTTGPNASTKHGGHKDPAFRKPNLHRVNPVEPTERRVTRQMSKASAAAAAAACPPVVVPRTEVRSDPAEVACKPSGEMHHVNVVTSDESEEEMEAEPLLDLFAQMEPWAEAGRRVAQYGDRPIVVVEKVVVQNLQIAMNINNGKQLIETQSNSMMGCALNAPVPVVPIAAAACPPVVVPRTTEVRSDRTEASVLPVTAAAAACPPCPPPVPRTIEVRSDPDEVVFKPSGGVYHVNVVNESAERRAFKVKCSDNQLYRVNPVYGVVEPGQSVKVDIQRRRGKPTQLDKLVILTGKAGILKDGKEAFEQSSPAEQKMLVVPLRPDDDNSSEESLVLDGESGPYNVRR